MRRRGVHGRRRSREAALQVLYALDLARDDDVEAAFDAVAARFELPEGARAFAKELVAGVTRQRAELDASLGRVSRRWRVERMPAVDRNILRLAAYELRHGALAREVAIDEAVELARRFGGERSPGFVNGVLDALARHPEGPQEPQDAP